jgi:hypothetical protein
MLLPTCDELMQLPFSPFADGAFLTRKSTQVVWKMRQDGSRELTLPSTCRLKRYTAHQARQCLKNKNLLFVGDSVMRFQFLGFAYFLEHGKWPKRFLSPTPLLDERDVEPNVCTGGNWWTGGWDVYHQDIGGGIDGGVFRGRMESQSVRLNPSVENLRYISNPLEEDGDGGEDGRIKLSYTCETKERFSGWKFLGCAYNATCRYTNEQYEKNIKRAEIEDFDWDYPNITTGFGPNGTTFREQHQDTNFVFYNRGIWGTIQEQKAKKMLALIYEMTGGTEKKSNRCFYRSTTGYVDTKFYPENEVMEYGPVRQAAFDAGCEYVDIAHTTEEFSHMLFSNPAPPRNRIFEQRSMFMDSIHYMPWVYEELNTLFLNILCGTQHFE